MFHAGVAVILVGILCRTSMTVLLGIGSIFSLKEKLFCSMAMATKATVQVRFKCLQCLQSVLVEIFLLGGVSSSFVGFDTRS